jgi:hypothetical protein
VCGDRIGVYEPAVASDHDGQWETSIAREPHLAEDVRALLMHAACAHGLMGRRPAPDHNKGGAHWRWTEDSG